MRQHFRRDFTFPRNYETQILPGVPPLHPLETLYHYPIELEEGDRTGAYFRIVPQTGPAWRGFFVLGFESVQAINVLCSCPNPDWFCAVVGGYAYAVNATNPREWFRVEQRPVTDLRVLREQGLLLFTGFTTITAVGRTGVQWTTERLSWEGISIEEIDGHALRGEGWDALSDKRIPFQVDLRTGKHSGGAAPLMTPG